MKNDKKPKVRFCWHCGNKLWGNHFTIMNIHGNNKVLHKKCAKDIKKNNLYSTDHP